MATVQPGGVFFRRGSQLRIPEGGIVITLDAEGRPVVAKPVIPQARTDMWPPWLHDAVDATVAARDAEALVLAEVATVAAAGATGKQPDQEHLADLLDLELRHSMRAITAAAFAVDAFYASVQARSTQHPDRAKWRKNRTARHAQVYETLRYHLKLRQPGSAEFRARIKELFQFRDWAVHPNAEWKNFEYRASLGRGVDWRYVAFCAPHAEAAVIKTLHMLDLMVSVLDRGGADLREAQPFFLEHVDRVFAAYDATSLPPIPRQPVKTTP